MKILFTCSGMWVRMKSSVAILKPVKVMMNVRNAKEVIMKVKSGCVVQYVVNGTMKTVFMSNLSHLVLLLDYINRLYINRLYYLLITFIYIHIWLKLLVFHKRFHNNSELWQEY